MDKKKKNLYCSLDIETSDFDPANGEILEIGMVFFELQETGIKILSEWESVFKPSREVSPRILALTGLTVEELEEAPQFRDSFEEIQKLVEDCIIVGHNISFDIKFLEGFGIKFSGKQLDTLDLAQMFLPTHSSYNLEALMGLLKVEHKDAHRALADAKASVVVMQKLLGRFSALPEEVRSKILALFPKKQFPELHEILSASFESFEVNFPSKEMAIAASTEISKALKQKNSIITFPLGFDHYQYIYGSLPKISEKALLVVPTKKVVYQLWKQKLAYPVFENREVFSLDRFEDLRKKPLEKDQSLFLAKILVWQATNWQSEILFDMNFSFGNQFRALVCFDPKEAPAWPISKEKVVAIDYLDFIKGKALTDYADRKVIIVDINGYEQALTYVSSKKVSWNDFIYAAKQIYDPATKSGNRKASKHIDAILSQVDLFFGLASLHFRRINESSSSILIDRAVRDGDSFKVILKAAESFLEKIKKANEHLESERISQSVENLENFFKEDNEEVKWVEISEDRLAFLSSPVSLEKISQQVLSKSKNILFTASLGSDSLLKYFTHRLNLPHLKIVPVGQQELRKKIEVVIKQAGADSDELIILLKTLEFPAALLMPNMTSLRNFYENNFKELQERYKVWAQSYSGGTNKLLENFSINENSLLITTDTFILRQVGKNLIVKSLIMTRLPFEQFTHPLFAAQAEKYENQFTDFNIPRALYNFHSLIRFFYGLDLERVYILDQKIHKDYGKYFLEYLESLPFVEIKRE